MAKQTGDTIKQVADILVLIGALAWGYEAIFASPLLVGIGLGMLEQIVYGLVGLSGLYLIYNNYLKK